MIPNQREEILMLILMIGEKYGSELHNLFQKQTKQQMPRGSLYTTLNRMKDKGFVSSRRGDANPKLGGNHRKFYTLTATGFKALSELEQNQINAKQ